MPNTAENDYYSYHWLTRYLYDLSQGGCQSFDGTAIAGHGNLYTT